MLNNQLWHRCSAGDIFHNKIYQFLSILTYMFSFHQKIKFLFSWHIYVEQEFMSCINKNLHQFLHKHNQSIVLWQVKNRAKKFEENIWRIKKLTFLIRFLLSKKFLLFYCNSWYLAKLKAKYLWIEQIINCFF